MAKLETLGILEDLSSLVYDRLQLVSYKWLSRNFLVSSNVAKKLLQEFVEQHKDKVEVVYAVSGWLKKAPPTYHIRLVPGAKLAETKNDFDGNCSVQAYSVQACIPKDPAAIWNAEFIQAEEFFKEPITVENCLRDNRFSEVFNSSVKRNAEGDPVAISVPQSKVAGIPRQAVGSSAKQVGSLLPPQQKKSDQASPRVPLQSSGVTTSRNESDRSGTCDLQSKESDKSNTSLPIKKKGQNGKNSAGTGSSLANLWGGATSKSKTSNSVEEKSAVSKTIISDSADAQINATENLEAASSDDDSDVNFKRVTNDVGKKRRVVLDDSDEEDYEMAVNLGSPYVPNEKVHKDLKQKIRTPNIESSILKFDEERDCKPMAKEEKEIADADLSSKEDFTARVMVKNVKIDNSNGVRGKTPDVDMSDKSKAVDAAAAGSPKRRKVLKTRIDERGREVTEVVWEAEEVDKDTNSMKSCIDILKKSNGHAAKVEDSSAANPVNSRAAPLKKSPAVGSTTVSHSAGKAGSKKGANSKDPKQGNILSFFKRV